MIAQEFSQIKSSVIHTYRETLSLSVSSSVTSHWSQSWEP